MHDPIPDAVALREVIAAASGIALDADEAAAVAAALLRMRDAVARYGGAPDFDLAIDRFYQLLEADAPAEAGR